jgi:hypothetical protein
MRLQSTHRIAHGKEIDVTIPNLSSSDQLVPTALLFEKRVGGEATSYPNLFSCDIRTSNSTVFSATPAYFEFNRSIDLKQYSLFGDVTLKLRNHELHARDFVVTIVYDQSPGRIIAQGKVSVFSQLVDQVSNMGVCTRLIVKASKPITSLNIINVFDTVNSSGERVDDQWLGGLELGSTDSENCYNIDFLGESLMDYSKNLRHLNFILPEDFDSNGLDIYFIAFGFPKGS